MSTNWLRGAALVMALALAGCGGSKPEPIPGVAPEDNETRLGEASGIDVAAWLEKPRAELAKLGDEWAKTLADQQKAARNDPRSVELLPRVLPPAVVPVFQNASYSGKAGFSLPAWLPAGKRDAAVAIHLARFGDHEAALKLADPKDAALSARLARLRCGRNYPVEWTRLVALVLASSQMRLAAGDVEGATALVRTHEQLRSALDAKASAGPLGSALLPVGERALTLAAKAWREPKRNKVALADDIDKAVAEWGKPPAVLPGLEARAAAAEVGKVFARPASGKGVAAAKPADVARAFDLLGLPLPAEGVDGVAAFLDGKGKLARLQLAYRAKIDTLYPEPASLAFSLVERGYSASDATKDSSLRRQTFRGDGLIFDIARSDRSSALGAVVALHWKDNSAEPAVADLRAIGPQHFDRGFDRNRLALVPNRSGETVGTKEAAALVRLTTALGAPAAESATIEREREYDVLRGVQLRWPAEANVNALAELLPGLWAGLGSARLEAREEDGGALVFVWQDEHTRAQLRLPFDSEAPTLRVEDTRPAGQLPARAKAVQQRDQTERKARLAAGKPEIRLTRSPGGVNDFSLERLQLGQSRDKAVAALPTGKSYRRAEVPEGVSLIVLTNPPKDVPYWARHVLLRFGSDNRLSEVRIRYEEGLAPLKRGDSLLGRLSSPRTGQPEPLPAPWAGLWHDVSPAGKLVYCRWQDDRTVRTYQHDGGLSEVVLRDRPTDDPSPKPWVFVRNGIPRCAIGATTAAVRAALGDPATTSDGADVHRMPSDSPYEMVLVWYQQDRVSKLLAVHRGRPGLQDKEVVAALQRVWTQNLDAFGFIRRREGRRDPVLGSYYWHDDRVRVRTSVQSDDEGGRVVTEWLGWE